MVEGTTVIKETTEIRNWNPRTAKDQRNVRRDYETTEGIKGETEGSARQKGGPQLSEETSEGRGDKS
jgi:hypothetical protein